jgi:signal transduction histidine kinase
VKRSDLLLAAVLTAAALVEGVLGMTGPAAGVAVLLTVPVATGSLAVRRVRPVLASALLVAACVVQTLLGSDLPGGLSEAVVLVMVVFAVGSADSWRTSLAGLGVILAGMAAVIGLGDDPRVGNFVYLAAVIGAAWAAGFAVRQTRERGRLATEQRLAAERTRLAGELHDVVAHHVTAIVVQAGAERRDLPQGSATAEALAGIEQQGRETLTQLRALLGVLHADDATGATTDGAPAQPHALAPQPGLRDLPELVEHAAATGVTVRLQVEGTPRDVGDSAGLTVYRVVQECLTNVRKHSASSAATVSLRWRPDVVEVEVHDPGPGRRTPWFSPSGFGLRGLGERVQAVGGRLVARREGDGFRVTASVPAEGLP